MSTQMVHRKISFMFVIFLIIQLLFGQSIGQNWLIDNILPDNYNPNVAPLIDGSVIVNVSMRVHKFDAGDNQLVSVFDD